MTQKIMKILSETEGNFCDQMLVDAPSGGLWPLIRKEVADYAGEYAGENDLGAGKLAKKVETELIMFGRFETGGFVATYDKSVFGTPRVSLEFDPDETDVLMRFNITYIVMP